MKYIKNIAESAFKLNTDDILSKGRVVTDTKEKIFKFQKYMYMFGLPIMMIFGLFFSGSIYKLHSLLVLGLPVLFFLLCQYLYLAVKNLPDSNHKLKYKETTSIALQGVPNWDFKFLYVLVSIIIVFGVFLAIIFNKPFSELMFLTSMMLGLGIAVFIAALVTDKQKAIQDA